MASPRLWMVIFIVFLVSFAISFEPITDCSQCSNIDSCTGGTGTCCGGVVQIWDSEGPSNVIVCSSECLVEGYTCCGCHNLQNVTDVDANRVCIRCPSGNQCGYDPENTIAPIFCVSLAHHIVAAPILALVSIMLLF